MINWSDIYRYYHVFNKKPIKSIRSNDDQPSSKPKPAQQPTSSSASSASSTAKAPPPKGKVAPGQKFIACAECSEPIEGEAANVAGKEYHLQCFKCRDCKRELRSQLATKQCLVVNGFPYCEQCGRKAFIKGTSTTSSSSSSTSSERERRKSMEIPASVSAPLKRASSKSNLVEGSGTVTPTTKRKSVRFAPDVMEKEAIKAVQEGNFCLQCKDKGAICEQFNPNPFKVYYFKILYHTLT